MECGNCNRGLIYGDYVKFYLCKFAHKNCLECDRILSKHCGQCGHSTKLIEFLNNNKAIEGIPPNLRNCTMPNPLNFGVVKKSNYAVPPNTTKTRPRFDRSAEDVPPPPPPPLPPTPLAKATGPAKARAQPPYQPRNFYSEAETSKDKLDNTTCAEYQMLSKIFESGGAPNAIPVSEQFIIKQPQYMSDPSPLVRVIVSDNDANASRSSYLALQQSIQRIAQGLPIHSDHLTITRIPLKCPDFDCTTLVAISDVGRHFYIDHNTHKMRIGLNQWCKLDLQPKPVDIGKNVIQHVCLVPGLVSNLGDHDCHDCLPVLIVSTAINMPLCIGGEQTGIEDNHFMVWLTALRMEEIVFNVRFRMCSADETFQLTRTCVAYDLRKSHAARKVYKSGAMMLLTQKEFRAFMRDDPKGRIKIELTVQVQQQTIPMPDFDTVPIGLQDQVNDPPKDAYRCRISREPVKCLDTLCGRCISVSEFNRHYIQDHFRVVECQATPTVPVEIDIDVKQLVERQILVSAIVLVENKITNLGSAPHKNFFPVLIATAYVNLVEMYGMRPTPKDKKHLMIWATTLNVELLPIYTKLVVKKPNEVYRMGQTCKTNDVRTVTTIRDVFFNGHRLLLSPVNRECLIQKTADKDLVKLAITVY